MAKTQALQIGQPLSEDKSGVIYRAKDSTGQRVHLRKPKPGNKGEQVLKPEEEAAYQLAISRLTDIHHPSLLQVITGGRDPQDGLPYITTKPVDAETLDHSLQQGPLSVEAATALLSQALEACDLLSYLLADEGAWIETAAESILVTKDAASPRFLFWPSPLKAACKHGKACDWSDMIELTERILNWKDRKIDEREGGHLQLWLKWLKDAGREADIHEAREMLAAAAGVEPPQAIKEIADQSKQKPGFFEKMPNLSEMMKLTVPKMPLFVLLSFMFVIQACIGWYIVRKINDSTDDKLKQMHSEYWSTPYTINNDLSRKHERGSQPLNLD